MSRVIFTICFIILGYSDGKSGLSVAAWLLLVNWTTDVLDGMIARLDSSSEPGWFGEHDLHIDILASFGLLLYMTFSSYIPWGAAAIFMLAWLGIVYHWGFQRPFGMLIQAPIYLLFVMISLRDASQHGVMLVLWIIAVIILTWPRFPHQVIPEFLESIRNVFKPR